MDIITSSNYDRDYKRLDRLTKLGLTETEIIRAGIKVWEDRKKLKPLK